MSRPRRKPVVGPSGHEYDTADRRRPPADVVRYVPPAKENPAAWDAILDYVIHMPDRPPDR